MAKVPVRRTTADQTNVRLAPDLMKASGIGMARPTALFSILVISGLPLYGQSAPELQIEPRTNHEVRLHWPLSDSFWLLEGRATLGESNLWGAVSAVPTIVTTNFQLDLQPATNSGFFRLRQSYQPTAAVVPNPETVAPPAPTNYFQSFGSATAFLYGVWLHAHTGGRHV